MSKQNLKYTAMSKCFWLVTALQLPSQGAIINGQLD